MADGEIMAIPDNPERCPRGQFIRSDTIIGRGSFKIVYEGLDTFNGIKIAWSKINFQGKPENEFNLFFQEAEKLMSLNHPNILKCHYFWRKNHTLNIITDLCYSGNLRDYITEHKLFGCKSAIQDWCRQILSALEYLHGQKPPIIHRDINGGNILINGNSGMIKLADFGISVYLREEDEDYQTIAGTPEYMARDLFLPEKYSELIDIHSFGMTVLRMMNQEKLYNECKTKGEIVRAVTDGVMPKALERVGDDEIEDFIRRCVAPASERPSARELLRHPFLATHRRPLLKFFRKYTGKGKHKN